MFYKTTRSSGDWRLQLGKLLLLVCGLCLGCQDAAPPALNSTDHLRAAKIALQKQQFEASMEHAESALKLSPKRLDALLIAAEAATRLQQYDRALAYYERMPDDGSENYRVGLLSAGDLLRHVGRMQAAEQKFRAVLLRTPADMTAVQRLSLVLNTSGRRWEALPLLLRRVQTGEFKVEELLSLGNVQRLTHNPESIEQALLAAPTDALPWLGKARVALEERDYAAAATHLDHALSAAPELVEAQIQLGWLHWQTGQHALLVQALATPQEATRRHPDFWVQQGLVAREYGQPQAALRCFSVAVQLDPDHRLAMYHLGQLLREHAAALPVVVVVVTRAEQLQQLDDLLEDLHNAPSDPGRLQHVAQLMLDLNRCWEAAAWSQVALAQQPQSTWPTSILQTARERLNAASEATTARTLALPTAFLTTDWEQFPLPDWSRIRESLPLTVPPETSVATIRWEDRAAAAGIDFQFYNDADPTTEGMRMLEFTGGGVGVLDYDMDGWPDIHFTQGCVWPARAEAPAYRDRLFRNLGQGGFADVTDLTRINELSYSQGVAVGDLDSDGFPDLYLANIGPNRLYINNGDGTYDDVTESAGIRGSSWTTSAVLADLNGDGHPEILDVNYLTGKGIFTQICQAEGKPRACNPTVFEGEDDQLWLNSGSGLMSDITSASGVKLPRGNGLGVIAADFGGDQGLDLFIANDAVPNFLLENLTEGAGAPPELRDISTLSGAAFDGDGRAQACMGVASADADGNGLLDLFITNYYRESNTLYLQESPLLFSDRAASYELRTPSFMQLGFGAQFVDADLDSWPDIIYVNGHVDDFSYAGTPYRMRPQFFSNQSGKTFVEHVGSELGAWFDEPQLGRSMARLDWNRDGRDDLAISHLDTPAALVTNITPGLTGNSFALRFSGVTCDRTAIGTTVRFALGERNVMQQLVSGDGYQASNERQLIFGLGTNDRAQNISITWPDGTEQVVQEIMAGGTYQVVQGRQPLLIYSNAGSKQPKLENN